MAAKHPTGNSLSDTPLFEYDVPPPLARLKALFRKGNWRVRQSVLSLIAEHYPEATLPKRRVQ